MKRQAQDRLRQFFRYRQATGIARAVTLGTTGISRIEGRSALVAVAAALGTRAGRSAARDTGALRVARPVFGAAFARSVAAEGPLSRSPPSAEATPIACGPARQNPSAAPAMTRDRLPSAHEPPRQRAFF